MFALNLPTRSQEGNQLAVLPKNTSEPSLGTSATIGCDSGKAARNPPWERWQSWELEQLPFPQQLPFPPGSSSLSSPACHTQHLQEWSIPSLGEADSSWIHSLQSREDCCHQPACTSGHNIKAKVLQITSPQGHHKMLGQNLSIPVLPAVPRTHMSKWQSCWWKTWPWELSRGRMEGTHSGVSLQDFKWMDKLCASSSLGKKNQIV